MYEKRDSVYCYKGTDVLVNKLEIKDKDLLKEYERQIVAIKLLELEKQPINNSFDIKRFSDIHRFLFFYVIILEYEEGNICDTEYVLEPSYIDNFLENAVIKHNDNNIDLGALIEGKTRYFDNDYMNSIEYILDGKYEVLYIFYVDDLTIIQVGLSDEGPKFIAYK